jgi:hypothetical protein
MGLYKTKKILHRKENDEQNEHAAYRMRKKSLQLSIRGFISGISEAHISKCKNDKRRKKRLQSKSYMRKEINKKKE